jgi:glycopeptide antibiotics resistance protein
VPTIDALPVLWPILAIYLVLVAVPEVRRRAGLSPRRLALVTLLVLYALAVVAITIFPIVIRPDEFWLGEPWWTVIHWIPFYVDAPSFVLNVIMMEPFGVLLPLLWPATGSVRRIALWSLVASAAIELSQLVLGLTLGSRRTVDINDLIANVGGAVVGLLVLRIVAVFRPGLVPASERPDQA